MRVRMKTIKAGPDGSAKPGDIITVEACEGRELVKGGFAEALDEPLKTESIAIEDAGQEEKRAPGRPKGNPKKRSDKQ